MLGRLMRMFLVCGIFGCSGVQEPTETALPLLPSQDECSALLNQACGEPVEGELDKWTWFPVAESQCLDGSSTGFGVRLGTDPQKVLLYLEGGGACYNTWSCENIFASKFTAEDFGEGKQVGIFNRDDEDNPFREWTHVYIPYCSGDMHSGSVPFGEGYNGLAHWGYQNISHYLKRLVPSFKEASRIALVGSSAGGFGATYNWLRVQRAFDPVPVDVIDDSGPFLSSAFLDSCYHKRVAQLWNQEVMFPEDCEDCLDSPNSFMAHLKHTREKLPQRRYALITEAEDYVIRAYFGFAREACSQWESETRPRFEADDFMAALVDYHHQTHQLENTFLYEAEGNGHVVLFEDFSDGLKTEQNGTRLSDWLEDFLSGAPLDDVMVTRQ